jgi:GNAT superfamily N-acetyltransferase
MTSIGFGDREHVDELLALRARSFAARIEGESEGRWIEIAGAFAFDWRGYRCVHHFGDDALRRLPELLDWFEDGPAPVFETYCGGALATTSEALILLGYQPFHAHALFAGALDRLESADSRASEAEVEISTDPADFGRLGAQMWNEGDPARAHALTLQHASPEWSCLTAIEAGRPIAGTSLFLAGPHAYHSNALTLPEAQGRGLHARLLRAHVELARERGKQWIVADTQVGSGSGRNFERAGLRCVATCLAWRPRA